MDTLVQWQLLINHSLSQGLICLFVPMASSICHFANVDGVVVLFVSGGNTSALHVVIQLIALRSGVDSKTLVFTCCCAFHGGTLGLGENPKT